MNDAIPDIWMMQTERNVRGLVRALQHGDPAVRRRAAAALRVIGPPEAAIPLRSRLQQEPDKQVRVAIVAALEQLQPIPPPEAPPAAPTSDAPTPDETPTEGEPPSRVDRLIEHLMSNRPAAAIQAAKRLGELGDMVAVPPLITLFRNRRQDPAVRLAAAEALLKMNSAPAEVTLLAALRSDKWTLRRNGAAILGQLQAEWAVKPLGAALDDPHPVVAKTALAALKRIGTPEAAGQIKTARLARANRVQTLNAQVGQQPTVPVRPKGITDKLRRPKQPPTPPENPKPDDPQK